MVMKATDNMQEATLKAERRPIRAWLTKRVMHTEREPLYDNGERQTIGQLVDAEIERFNTHVLEYPSEMTAPVIHSVTVEFPTE